MKKLLTIALLPLLMAAQTTAASDRIFVYYQPKGAASWSLKWLNIDSTLYLYTDSSGQEWLGAKSGVQQAQGIDAGPSVACSGSTCTICPDCSPTTPHNVGITPIPTISFPGGASSPVITYGARTVYTLVTPSKVTITGSPVVRFYISDGSDGTTPGILEVGNSLTAGAVTCDAYCLVRDGVTQFSGLPIAIFQAGPQPAFQDLRAGLSK